MRALWLLLVAACAATPGRPFSPARLDREPGWLATRPVTLTQQEGAMDCGPAAAAMILAFWDRPAPLAELRAGDDRGLAAVALRDLLRARGLEAYVVQGQIADLERELEAGRPAVVGSLREGPDGIIAHYQVVAALHRANRRIVVADPAAGWRELPLDGFDKLWSKARRVLIVAFPPPLAHLTGRH